MSGEERLLGEIKATQEDHERRLGVLEKESEAIKRFQTSFMAILTAAVATAGIWWKGFVALIVGNGHN